MTNVLDTPFAARGYRLVRDIGRGNSAAVWEAVHVALGRRVAIKIPHAGRADSEMLAERFAREGRAAASVRHPHVVDVLDVGEHDGRPFLVMELVEGTTLAAMFRDAAPLSLPRLLDLLLPVMAGVQHAHDCGVFHRDLKPANILVGRDRFGDPLPKVADFGICRRADDRASAAVTEDGALIGTLAYMAPEQARDPKGVDARADQYALGVMLYQGATGALPFDQGDTLALLDAIGRGDAPAPRSLRPDLPAAFEEAVLRAMQVDRADRFASVRELARALLPLASGRAWNAFARDFEDPARELAPAMVTSEDDVRAVDTGGPLVLPARARSSFGSRAWLALGGVLVLSAVAFALPRALRGSTLASPLTADRAEASALPAGPPKTDEAPSPPPVAVAPAPPPPSVAAPPPAVPARLVHTSRRPPVTVGAPDAGAASTPPSYELGDHGAPILE